ncbi:PKD domain-containing protein, partial [Mongoliibacter ruber]
MNNYVFIVWVKKALIFAFVFLFFSKVFADCTINTDLNQTEFIDFLNSNEATCNGTVIIPAGIKITLNSTITVPNHINQLIIEDGGQILWASNNVNLILPQNTALVIENTSDVGTQTGAIGSTTNTCSNNRRIIIGGIQYSACSGQGNVCLVFGDLIESGGTPKIEIDVVTIGIDGNEVCVGTTLLGAEISGLPDGVEPTNYSWTQESGPGTIIFDSPNTEGTEITALTPGIYTIRLTVTVPLGPEGTDCFDTEVTVFSNVVLNFLASPVADFTFLDPGCDLMVNFDASSSIDVGDNGNLLYEWDFSYDGATFNTEGSGQTIQNTFPTSGNYNVALKVTDPDVPIDCQEDIKEFEVVILAVPAAPQSNGDITECATDPLQTLNANDAISAVSGITYRWYDSIEGLIEVIPTLNSIGSVTFYAEAVSADGCVSMERTPVTLELVLAQGSIISESTACEPGGDTYVITATIEAAGTLTAIGTGAPGTFFDNANGTLTWSSEPVAIGTDYDVSFEDDGVCDSINISGTSPVCCVSEIVCPEPLVYQVLPCSDFTEELGELPTHEEVDFRLSTTQGRITVFYSIPRGFAVQNSSYEEFSNSVNNGSFTSNCAIESVTFEFL